MKIAKLTWAALAMAPLVLGCGGTDLLGSDGAMGSMDMASSSHFFRLQSGAYMVSNLVMVSDSCMQNLSTTGANPFAMLQVTNDGMGNVSMGDMHTPTGAFPQYSPAGYSQGTGMFPPNSNGPATLTLASTMVTADSAGACTYTLSRTNTITLTADDMLTVHYMQTQTNHSAMCTPVTTDCTSEYTYMLGMPVH